jgi:hypothetical protein
MHHTSTPLAKTAKSNRPGRRRSTVIRPHEDVLTGISLRELEKLSKTRFSRAAQRPKGRAVGEAYVAALGVSLFLCEPSLATAKEFCQAKKIGDLTLLNPFLEGVLKCGVLHRTAIERASATSAVLLRLGCGLTAVGSSRAPGASENHRAVFAVKCCGNSERANFRSKPNPFERCALTWDLHAAARSSTTLGLHGGGMEWAAGKERTFRSNPSA